jgi:hypothetical protein
MTSGDQREIGKLAGREATGRAILARAIGAAGAVRGRMFFPVWLLAAAGTLVLAGCGHGAASTNVSSVAITPTSISVPINGNAEFSATINLSNSTISTTTTVTWEVNGAAGGSATIGTITPSSVDADVGIYTAPAIVPDPSQVNITAVVEQTNTSGTSNTIPTVTSNTSVVTIGAGLGLAVTPSAATVGAGGSQQFTAVLNGLPDPGATWAISSASGITDSSVIGSIDLTGLYTAPASPPPGSSLTITATDGTNTATATATVVYSDLSLNGPYVFSYAGSDRSGYLAAAGSFVADGNGHILTNGVEDIDSFLTGVATQVAISGTYTVGPDGRGTATINRGQVQEIWKFALTTGQHAQLTLFEQGATAGGTIDQQSVAALSNSATVISGPYVFSVLGADGSAGHAPLGMAGEFTADGSGNIQASQGSILDVNDNGTLSTSDTSLNGSYSFDQTGTGRGTMTLQSTSTGATARRYAFYAVSTALNPVNNQSYVTELRLIEIDRAAYVAGNMFSAPSAASLSTGDLGAYNYVFTNGGNSSKGAYAAGGVFESDGNGDVTSGVLDTNNAGTSALNTTLGACSYTLNATKRRIDLRLFAGSGTCPSGANPSVSEFAAYQTSLGSAVMLELDSGAVATGVAYQQCGPSTAGCAASSASLTANSVALGLSGQGIYYNPSPAPSNYQQDIDGQVTIGAGVTPGTIDVNNFSAVFANDPISETSLGSPSTNGRGTAVVTATNPSATYNLIYYLIDDNTALLFDQDQTYILRGTVLRQY